MGRMSTLVSMLLAFALAATVLAAALLVGLFPGGGGTAVATTRPPQASGPLVTSPPVATPSPTPTPIPTQTDAGPQTIPPEGTTYTVQPGDALSLIGERFEISWLLIAQANNIPPPDYIITPGQVLIIPAAGPEPSAGAEFYIVQSGDTITSIAQAVGIEPTALADFNNIADWNTIQVGQVLYIPSDVDATPLPRETP
ncbi:MAG TPA: LysM peptidoglycan-binding domain-containing protein [Candidatus Limnocylindrales bacterium]|nr:LysM peptidoglycan-binding domain-containing protein [Candidatus Limnocylindrales bacterium]